MPGRFAQKFHSIINSFAERLKRKFVMWILEGFDRLQSAVSNLQGYWYGEDQSNISLVEHGFYGFGLMEFLNFVITSFPFFAAYYIGHFRFSGIWMLILVGLVFGSQFAISRSKSQHKLIQQLMTLCSLPKLQSLSTKRRLEILRKFTEAHLASPEILRQPDYEQMEWFNDILKMLWPSLCDYTKREIFSKVAPLVKDAAPQLNLRIRSFELGAVPPQITGIKVHNLNTKTRSSVNEIIIDIEASWISEFSAQVSVLNAPAELNQIEFEGLLRINMGPLLSDLPLAGGISATFLKPPKIDFSLVGLAKFANTPIIHSAIKKSLDQVIASQLVIPNRLDIPFSDNLISEIRFRMPAGILRVFVLEAKDLANDDFFGESDPYVTLTVGAQTKETEVVFNNCKNPIWWSDSDPGFIFDFLIHDQFNQQIQVDIYDKDADWDDHLGGFSIDIISIVNNCQNKSMMQWFKLNDGAQGEVRLQLCFLELSQDKLHHGIKPLEVARQNFHKLKSASDNNVTRPSNQNGTSALDLPELDRPLSARDLPLLKTNDYDEGSSVDLPTMNSDALTALVRNIMKLPMNPNRYVLGLYLDSVEGTSIKRQMVLNVIVTETVAGDEERTHTRRSKIATGPNYNFAETFFVFLEYAHKVKISIDLCYPDGLRIATKFLLEKDIHCQFKVTANEFNEVFKDPMWALKKSVQAKNGTLNLNLCVRSLDGQLKCFDIPDLVERSKTRHEGLMAKLKKFSLKPSSAFSSATIKPKERITSFKKALRNRKSKIKNRKSTIL